MAAGQVLIACWFIKFCCGGLAPNGTLNSFYVYIAEDWNVPISSVALMNTLMCLTMMLLAPVMGRAMARYPPKRVIRMSFLTGLSGYLLCSAAPDCRTLYLCGILIGVGNACLTYSAVPLMINLWYRSNIATMISLATSGQALGKLLFSPVSTYLTAAFGWRNAMLFFGILSGVLFLSVTGLFLKNSPESIGLSPYDPLPGGSSPPQDEATGLPAGQVFRSPVFFLLAVSAFFAGYCLSVNTSIVAIAKTSGALSAGAAGFSGSAIAAGMLIGEPAFGAMLDRDTNLRRPLLLFTLIQAAGLVLAANIYLFPGLILAGSFLIGLGVGATAIVLIPSVCRLLFGRRTYGAFYQKLVAVISAANAVSSYLTNYLYDLTGSYALILYVMAGITLLIFLFVILAVRQAEQLLAMWE